MDAYPPARVGDRLRFQYPTEPQFDCTLTVEATYGDGPDDLVFFDDGTHAKQKGVADVPRVAG